jgi:hypothetical protein
MICLLDLNRLLVPCGIVQTFSVEKDRAVTEVLLAPAASDL